MLKAHLDNKENILVSQSKGARITGHPLHKGTPRESFIHEFLKEHLPSTISIGTGEIIDSNSKPGESRNQYDLILYRNDYPKLNIGGNIHAFLIESVVATIEVKSKLTSTELRKAISAARNSKKLTPNIDKVFSMSGRGDSGIKNFVVAYDGPAKIETVFSWIGQIHKSLDISIPELPPDKERFNIPSPSIDGIFVLKKGFLYFDNIPFIFQTQQLLHKYPNIKWVTVNSEEGVLLMFFHLLQEIIKTIHGTFLNAYPYLKDVSYNIHTFD